MSPVEVKDKVFNSTDTVEARRARLIERLQPILNEEGFGLDAEFDPTHFPKVLKARPVLVDLRATQTPQQTLQ